MSAGPADLEELAVWTEREARRPLARASVAVTERRLRYAPSRTVADIAGEWVDVVTAFRCLRRRVFQTGITLFDRLCGGTRLVPSRFGVRCY